MATNNFLPFCPTDSGTNLLSQSAYAAATDRDVGNQPGVASSKLNNKALRQTTFVTSQIAQYLADKTGADVLDGGLTATLLGIMNSAMLPKAPVIQRFTSGSGTYNRTYVFSIATGSATAGATYTNNSITFTVVQTVASGALLVASGSNVPSVSGTLTKASGTGDATIAFYAYQAPLYIDVECLGGGGGGGGGGSSGGAGGAGGTTTFGSSLLTSSGGQGGSPSGGAGGPGGSATCAAPGIQINALVGGAGSGGGSIGGANPGGGAGAASPFSGNGGGSGGLTAGTVTAIANTGSGGGGGAFSSTNQTHSGAGGGSAGYIRAILMSPSVTYTYAIGAAGAAGTAGSSGGAGGAGGSGIVIVREYYQ